MTLAAPFRASLLRTLTTKAVAPWSVGVVSLVAPLCALTTAWLAARVSADALPRDIALRELQSLSATQHVVALTVSSTLAAAATASERATLPRDLFALSPMTGATRARASAFAAWLLTTAALAQMAPLLAAPLAFHDVLVRTLITTALSATLWAAAGASLGVRIGATAPDASSAVARAVALGATLALIAWYLVGRALGAATCAHFHIADHGGAWWAEVIFDGRVPTRTRVALAALLAAAPLATGNLLLSAGAARLSDDGDTTTLRGRWLVTSGIALAACAAAPRFGGALGGRTAVAIIAAAAWGALQLVGVALALGRHRAPSRRTQAAVAASRAPWLRRALAGGVPTAFALHAATMFAGLVALAFVHGRLLGAAPHGALASASRLLVGAVFFPVSAAGFLARTFSTPRHARAVLLVLVAAWALVPLMLATMLDTDAVRALDDVTPRHLFDELLRSAHARIPRPPSLRGLLVLSALVTAATLPVAMLGARRIREEP